MQEFENTRFFLGSNLENIVNREKIPDLPYSVNDLKLNICGCVYSPGMANELIEGREEFCITLCEGIAILYSELSRKKILEKKILCCLGSRYGDNFVPIVFKKNEKIIVSSVYLHVPNREFVFPSCKSRKT